MPIHAIALVHRALLWLLPAWLALVALTDGARIGNTGWTASRATLEPVLLAWLGLWLVAIPVRERRLRLEVFRGHEVRLLLVATLGIYLANGENHASADSWPTRYLPLSILRDLDFDLDEFPFLYEGRAAYYLEHVRGRYVSQYPVAPALLALPFYVLPAIGGVPAESALTATLEKLTAAVLVALSVVVLYLAARRLCERPLAGVLALTYGLGTSALSVSSQALWQHGPSQLAVTAALYALLWARQRRRWLVAAGLALGFAVICRPTNAVLAAALAAYALWRHGRPAWRVAAGSAPPLLFQAWYNARYFGDPLRTQFSVWGGGEWHSPLVDGLAGLLLSPGRGLVVYSPVLVLGLIGAVLAWTRRGDALLRSLSLGTVVTLLLYAKWSVWWGGHSYGPRLLADLAPGLVMLIIPLTSWLERSASWRGVYAVLLAWSVLAHGLGAFWEQGGLRWNRHPDVDRFPSRLWDWKDAPPLNGLRDLVGRGRSLIEGPPTSGRQPDAVRAAVSVSSGLSWPLGPRSLPRAVQLTVTAVNNGPVSWLSTGGTGKVVLAWRFVGPGSGEPAATGHIPLRHDLPPGRRYEFTLDLDPPRDVQPTALGLALVVTHEQEETTVATATVPLDFSDRHRLVRRLSVPSAGLPERAAGAARVAPALRLILDGGSARRGSRLVIGFDLAVPPSAPEADLYVGVIHPDGSTASMVVGRSELTDATTLIEPRQLRSLRAVSPGTALLEPAIADLSVPTYAPAGEYRLFAALLRAGATASTALAADDVLALDVKPLNIMPR